MPSGGLARQNVVVGVSITFTAISVLIVSLRTYTRIMIVRNIGNDDYAMLLAVFFTLAYLAALLFLRGNGMGLSGKVLSMDEMTNTLKTVVPIEILYYLYVNAIKISILFFYLRIAVQKTFSRLCKGTIAFLSTFCIICVIVCLVQCLPLHKLWDLTGLVQGTCINTTAFFYMTSSTNIAVDIWIIILPIKVLLSIHRPTREKIALVAIFALGALSYIAPISSDPFLDSVPVNTWSMVEINVGIYCASTPALKALFSKSQRERSQRISEYPDNESGGSKATGKKPVTEGSSGIVVKNDVVVMESLQRDRSSAHNGEYAPGHCLAGRSQERIVVPESRV